MIASCLAWFFGVGFQFDFKFVAVTPHEGGTFFWTKVIDSKAAAASADEKKEAPKQARENNAKIKKENKIITSLAAKAMPLLKPMVKRLTDLCAGTKAS